MAFVARIKVCEASKLPKADLIGKSDPFVKVYLKSNKKLVKKTKTIKNTQNPTWNEEFEFKVESQTDRVVFHVYDEDKKSSEELAEKVDIPLSDFKIGEAPVARTLDLTLKKKKAGTLKVEIRLLPFEATNVEPKPILLNIKLVKATKLAKMDPVGKSDPYAVFQLKGYPQDKAYRFTSTTKDNTLDPVWNEVYNFNCKDWNTDVLVFQMFDKDVSNDDQMVDDVEFRLNQFPLNKRVVWSEDVTHKKKFGGHVDIEFEAIDLSEPQVQSRGIEIKEEQCSFTLGSYPSSYATSFSSITCSHQLSDLHSSERREHASHKTVVEKTSPPKPIRIAESISGVLIGCNDLVKIGNDPVNTYAVIHVLSKALYEKKGKPSQKSDVVNDSTDPVYNLVFDYQKVSKGDSLQIEVFQTNQQNGDLLIGDCIIPLKNVNENQTYEQEFPIVKPRKFPNDLGSFKSFGTAKLSLTHNVQYQ